MVQQNQEDLFSQLAEEEPVRDTEDYGDFGSGGGGGDRTLEDYEHNSPNLTDLQYLIKTLSPNFKNDVYNAFMYSRLSPDTFKPMFKLAVNAEIKRQNPYKPLEVVPIAMTLYTVLTKALDGKHIIDVLEAFGSKVDTSHSGDMNMGLNG